MDKKDNDEDYYFNSILEEEILNNDKLTTEEWVNMYKIYASELLKFAPFAKLTKRSKLCIAMVIVGAKVLTKYHTAFRLLCYWQSVGGCYWIVQEEVLRHAAIEIVREGFQPFGDFDSETVKMKLSKVLPSVVPSYVTHLKLREKLALLSEKILALVAQLDIIENPKATFDAYCKKYPLDDYVKWFLNWAHSVLRKPLNTKFETKCQHSIQYSSGLKPKISGNVPPLIREGAKENKGDSCNKPRVITDNSSGTIFAGCELEKSARLSKAPQPVASNGFQTPAKKKRPASSSVVHDKQDVLKTTWTINAAVVTGDKADCETRHSAGNIITSAALSTVPQLSKQQKIQQLFLNTCSPSDSATLKDVASGRNVSSTGDIVRNTDEEDESLSTLSYDSIHLSSAASSTGDEEIATGNIQKETPPNIRTNISPPKGLLRSPSFIPYSANTIAEEEENRKRGILFDVSGDEEMAGDGRPSFRDAKRRRFNRPIANMTLSERIGHLIWEMFSPQCGAGANSDCDSDGEYMS